MASLMRCRHCHVCAANGPNLYLLSEIVYMQRKKPWKECALDFDFSFSQQLYDVTQNWKCSHSMGDSRNVLISLHLTNKVLSKEITFNQIYLHEKWLQVYFLLMQIIPMLDRWQASARAGGTPWCWPVGERSSPAAPMILASWAERAAKQGLNRLEQ